MTKRNLGCDLDLGWLNSIEVNLSSVYKYEQQILRSQNVTDANQIAWLLKTITFIDLTTLGGDDTPDKVSKLSRKACRPLSEDLLTGFGLDSGEKSSLHAAAVCVYPVKIEYVIATLKEEGFLDKINVASVAAGFPSGQYPLSTRLKEIEYAISKGAKEIDIVIDRSLVLTDKWEQLYNEIKQMRETCGQEVHMKTILSCGELANLENVYKASLVAMMAGSDFIKTSTGKETVNATIPFGIVMSLAIKDFEAKTGYKVGLKPAGGIKSSKDAINWLILVKELLGNDWLTPEMFRFGASGLLTEIEKDLYEFVKSHHPVGGKVVHLDKNFLYDNEQSNKNTAVVS